MFVAGKPKQTKRWRSKLKKKQANLGFMKQMGGWVYIMCSINHSTLYVGVTSNIASRVYEHKHKMYPESFTFEI